MRMTYLVFTVAVMFCLGVLYITGSWLKNNYEDENWGNVYFMAALSTASLLGLFGLIFMAIK